MYFWKIDNLNEELVTSSVTEADSFKYLLANVALYMLAAFHFPYTNSYDLLGSSISLVIAVAGLIFIYKCNGGREGSYIMLRYLSISWVVLIRMLVWVIPLGISFYIAYETVLGGLVEDTSIVEILFVAIIEIIYVYLIAKNVNNVAKKSYA